MKKSFDALFVILTAVIFTAFVQGCGTSGVNSGTPATLVSLSVTPPNSSIAPGTTAQLTATGTYSNGSMQNLTSSATWTSSTPGIATISNTAGSKGLATATTSSIGSTTISALYSGITATTTLSTSHVSLIAVTPSSPPCIAPGTTQQFIATGTLSDTNSTQQNLTAFATWMSLNTTVADVGNTASSKGLAIANDAGTADIRAAYDGIPGFVTLASSHVGSIAVTPTSTSMPKGLTQQFVAIGTLSGGCSTTQSLTTWATWSTSNAGVATISNASSSKGLATALAVGSTNITALFDSVTSSPTATLTVTPAVLTAIDVTPKNTSIALGLTQQYKAKGTYSDGSMLDLTSAVTWISSQSGVASMSISTNGLATSVAQGTTTITASLFNVTSNNSATLTVTPPVLVSIAVTPDPATISLALGETTRQFTATGTFTSGPPQVLTTSVTWLSSNTKAATISTTGLATVSFGEPLPSSTNITARFSGVPSITSTPVVLTVVNF